jgi:N-acetylglutamate synthase-like GNAT family acetyltransferase
MNKTKLTFRKGTEEDMEFLLWLRKQTMTEHLLHAGKEVNEENLLDRIKHHFEHAKIILQKDQKIGLLKLVENESEIEILQIQIEPNHQNKGIGKEIIQSIIQKASTKNIPVKLSVLKTNKAKNLCKTLGFEIYDKNEYSYFMKRFKPLNNLNS